MALFLFGGEHYEMAQKKLVAADDYRGGGNLVMVQAGGVGGVVIICHLRWGFWCDILKP